MFRTSRGILAARCALRPRSTMPNLRTSSRAALVGALCAALPHPARAAGFVVGTTDAHPVSDAASVVVVREGARSVMTLAVDVVGPAAPLALVVPVPPELAKADVRVVPADVVDHLERFAGPRVVELVEQDPCADAADAGARGPAASAAAPQSLADKIAAWKARGGGPKAAAPAPAAAASGPSTGDYEVTVLGAADSIGLDKWLEKNGYRLPEGAAAKLRRYTEGGNRFVVARIDGAKLAFEGGRAHLPPLSFTFEAEGVKVALGALAVSAADEIDVRVTVLARQRFDPTAGAAPPVPTGLALTPAAEGALGPFYAALTAATASHHKATFVTEHAGSVGACAPCAAPPIAQGDLVALGAELGARPADALVPAKVLMGAAEISGSVKDAPRGLAGAQAGFAKCYGEALKEKPDVRGSLRLTATLIDTGEVTTATPQGAQGLPTRMVDCLVDRLKEAHFAHLPEGARAGVAVPVRFTPPATVLTPKNVLATRLRARLANDAEPDDLVMRAVEAPGAPLVASYEIRRAWSGAAACAAPKRGVFAGADGGEPKAKPIDGVASAKRAGVELAKLVAVDVPAIGLDRSGAAKPAATAEPAASASATAARAPEPPPAPPKKGCTGSIAGGDPGSRSAWAIALGALLVAASRRARRRG